jgi:hypothetical protein
MSSKIYKGTNGWTGETTFPGAENEYTWKITTLKRSLGKIASYATAWQYEDGSLVWDMFMAPNIPLGEIAGTATEATIKAAHFKAEAMFEIMRDNGELPEREAPKSDSDYSANNFGLTESEGDGDSHIGDAWKDNLNEPAKDPNEKPLGKVDSGFFIENKNLIRGSIQDEPQLIKGYEFVIASTNNGLSWDEYKEDEFTRKMINAFFRDLEPVLKRKKPYLFAEQDGGYTGHKWEGSAYKRTKSLDITEIAKLAREEFAAIFPEMKWSVRIDRFSGGQSINATGTNYPYNPYTAEYLKQISEGKTKSEISESNWRYKNAGGSEMFVEVYNEQFEKDKKKAEKVLGQYRYSDSDGMIDYFSTNFYDHTKIELDDWDQKLFADDPEVKRSKEFWERVEKEKKEGSQSAKNLLEEKGILPKWTIVKYKTNLRGLGETIVPAVIYKSPNGRSRYSLDYGIYLLPPPHPKAGYKYSTSLSPISHTSVELDKEAARLPLAAYKERVYEITRWPKEPGKYGTDSRKKYAKAIEKAWKFARTEAGISEAPKKKAVSQPDKKPAAPAKPKGNEVAISELVFTVSESKHTKTGTPIFIAKTANRVGKEDYYKLAAKAKKEGGYYSRFVGGFIFKDEASANSFAGKAESKATTKKEFIASVNQSGIHKLPGENEVVLNKQIFKVVQDYNGHVILKDKNGDFVLYDNLPPDEGLVSLFWVGLDDSKSSGKRIMHKTSIQDAKDQIDWMVASRASANKGDKLHKKGKDVLKSKEPMFKKGDQVKYKDSDRMSGYNTGVIDAVTSEYQRYYVVSPDAPYGARQKNIHPNKIIKVLRTAFDRTKDKKEAAELEKENEIKDWGKTHDAKSIIALAKASGFTLESWNNRSQTLSFATRENGNVGEETQGKVDLDARKELIGKIRKSFSGIEIEKTDSGTEWVEFEVTFKKQLEKAPEPTPDPERLKILRLKAKALKLKYKYQ